jgi:hypothetical protein
LAAIDYRFDAMRLIARPSTVTAARRFQQQPLAFCDEWANHTLDGVTLRTAQL